jgi:hypothetical protein
MRVVTDRGVTTKPKQTENEELTRKTKRWSMTQENANRIHSGYPGSLVGHVARKKKKRALSIRDWPTSFVSQ